MGDLTAEKLLLPAVSYEAAARAPATDRAYASDWRHFTAWAAARGLQALPAAPETLVWYLSDYAGELACSTLGRRLVAIGQAHEAAGHEPPTRAAVVRRTYRGIRRTFGTAARGKAPARTALVRRMVAACHPTRLIGARDRALLVIGFAGAFRRSELVALDVEDVLETPDGLVVTVRRSKTDQEAAGEDLGLPYGSDPATCPVRALRAWLEAAEITAGPIFRPMHSAGHRALPRRLSGRAVADVVHRIAEQVGLDPALYAGHSLRAGLITSAADAGVAERDIMRHSRHRSAAMMRKYIRDAQLFQANAAVAVGL